MLVDELRAREMRLWHTSKIRVADAVVFRVEEGLLEFANTILKEHKDKNGRVYAKQFMSKSLNIIPLAQRLPYTNIVIHCTNGFVWVFECSGPRNIGLVVERSIDNEDLQENVVLETQAYWVFGLDENMKPIETLFMHKYGREAVDEDCLFGMIGFAAVVRFLDFLSCKNVRAKNVSHATKLQISRKKKGKLPLVSYKILELLPVGNSRIKENGKRLWTNRVHLCRGHVALYGAEYGRGLLFGKYAGRFWIPPHVKGNKKKGVVVKDYQLPSTSGEV